MDKQFKKPYVDAADVLLHGLTANLNAKKAHQNALWMNKRIRWRQTNEHSYKHAYTYEIRWRARFIRFDRQWW